MNSGIIHRHGSKAVYESKSPDESLSCVFEDDGATGYFYVLEHADAAAQPIKDAVSIYEVSPTYQQQHAVEFRWSADGRRCGFLLDDRFEAFVDFDTKAVTAKSNFPPLSLWTQEPREKWTDAVIGQLDKAS
jgi:hypothetical protein